MVELEGYNDRERSKALSGCEVGVGFDQLNHQDGEAFYWIELEGMSVVTVRGEPLGEVTRLMETGANDVLVVGGEGKRERLIPWGRSVVVDVDREKRAIEVDWDPEY